MLHFPSHFYKRAAFNTRELLHCTRPADYTESKTSMDDDVSKPADANSPPRAADAGAATVVPAAAVAVPVAPAAAAFVVEGAAASLARETAFAALASASCAPFPPAPAPSPPRPMPAFPSPPASISAAVLSGYVGDFYRLLEGLEGTLGDLKLDLPQIVVIGQESSGKSSVLESLAMMPLFPRDKNICTRMPIRLKMRHVPMRDFVGGDPELMPSRGVAVAGAHEVHMKLIYSDERPPTVAKATFTPEEASPYMAVWMNKILNFEKERNPQVGVMDHILEVEVRSPLVPNLNLVDLPGIVSGRLAGEPDDMMQQTRALVEKYLAAPPTLVLAVVPASEHTRNSQAFQLVQHHELTNSTIGVLTMVDLVAQHSTSGSGPLARVMERLDGTSGDIVELKHGYVAVMNRDTTQQTQCSLEAFKKIENAYLRQYLPGYFERNLASSTALAHKLEKMLAEHVTARWVPHTLEKVENERKRAAAQLALLGPSGEKMASGFLGDTSPTVRRGRVFRLVEAVLPRLLDGVDAEMLELMSAIHQDFVRFRDEHTLMLAPYQLDAVKGKAVKATGCSMMGSMLILESYKLYIRSNLSAMFKNIALRLVLLIHNIIADGEESKAGAEPTPSLRLERFMNLHLLFASSIWEQLNELLVDEDTLLERIEEAFYAFESEDQGATEATTADTTRSAEDFDAAFVEKVRAFLGNQGFQNTSIDKLFVYSPPTTMSLTMDR